MGKKFAISWRVFPPKMYGQFTKSLCKTHGNITSVTLCKKIHHQFITHQFSITSVTNGYIITDN